MKVGGVPVPGSRAFLLGTGVTFGIVALAGIVTALPVPLVGLLLFVGWGIGFVAGVAGGAVAASSGNVETGGDGAKIGTLVGGLGNLAGAVVGVVAFAVAALVGFESTTVPAQAPGGSPTTIGSGDLLIGIVLVGGVGLVTGTVTALIGGAVGGFVGSRI